MQGTLHNSHDSLDIVSSGNIQESYIAREILQDDIRMNQVSDIAKEFGAMEKTCRISVCIPAYRESGIITNTLENYTLHQRTLEGKGVDPNIFEINILVNRPSKDSERDTVMLQEIQDFRDNHPEYRINIAEIAYDFPEKPLIGRIFKDITDAVILRNIARNVSEGQKSGHIIRTAGADLESLNPLFISRTIDLFSNKYVMAHRGETRLPSELLRSFPLLHVMQALAVFLLRQYHGAHTTNGPFSYTAHAYASVDGFSPTKILGEEIDLAERIWKKTQGSQGELLFVRDCVKDVLNNPRRQVHALLGLSTSMATRYNEFGRKDNENNVRKLSLSWRDMIAGNLPGNCILNPENLSREISEYYRTYIRMATSKGIPTEEIDALFKRGLRQFGITDYNIFRDSENSAIIIHSVHNLHTQIQGHSFSWMKSFPNYRPVNHIVHKSREAEKID